MTAMLCLRGVRCGQQVLLRPRTAASAPAWAKTASRPILATACDRPFHTAGLAEPSAWGTGHGARGPWPLQGFAARSLAAAPCTPAPRGYSSAPPAEDEKKQPEETAPTADAGPTKLVYTGHMSVVVKRVKILSAASLFFNCIGAPIIVFMGSPEMAFEAKIGIASSFAVFGAFTTGLLHWFTMPYVHKMWYDKEGGRLGVETLSVLATAQRLDFTLDDVAEPDSIRPLTTFAAKGKLLYVDKDRFEDKELLELLAPEEEPAQPLYGSDDEN